MAKKFNKPLAAMLIIALMATAVPMKAEAATRKTLYVGKTTTLKAAKKATWKSSNKKVATVSKKGKVTAKKAGKATITAKKKGKVWKFKITVKNPYLNRKTANLKKGDTFKLKLTGASIKSCTSSNEKVASVNNTGTVKAVSTGSAVVSVTASNKKTYKCSIRVTTDEASTVSEENPTATPDTKGCIHRHLDYAHPVKEWGVPVPDVYYVSGTPYIGKNSHELYGIYKCKDCGETKEEFRGSRDCDFHNEIEDYLTNPNWTFPEEDYRVVKEPTCTEDGKRYQFCSICGRQQENATWCSMNEDVWEYFTTIPHLGHDFEYEYKREISVQPGWYNRDYPGASKTVMESPFGERIATCKRCGKSFEEVGIDTGTELNDGSRQIVWGVWRKDKEAELLSEINKYRQGQDGINRESLLASETLNKAAVYILAEEMQMWTTYGSPAAIRDIYDNGAPVRGRCREIISGNFQETKQCYDFQSENVEYVSSDFIYDNNDAPISPFRFNQDLKYAGVACFDIEKPSGNFQMGVLAVGAKDESIMYECNHDCSATREFGATNYWENGEFDETADKPCKKCSFVFPAVNENYN